VEVTGLAGLERLVLGPGRFRLQIAQIAHPVATQTPVETGARDIRVQELPNHRQQVIQRNQKRGAQCHRDRLLRKRQRGLQPVGRVAAVKHAVAVPPLVDRLLGRPEPLRQDRRRLVARLDRRPHPWRRRCLLVKMDQHGRTPSRMSLRTGLAMKKPDRRKEM
jgi:hypothetical protein